MTYSSVAEIVKDLEHRPIESGGHIYHPIPFPEFDHLTTSTSREETLVKRAKIEAVLRTRFGGSFEGRRILDIGANGGFYSFHFASLGASVTSYEGHERYGPIGAFLAAQPRVANVEWHDQYFGQADLKGRHFDAALMLSVFQWISRGDEGLADAKTLLRGISDHADALVFELGFNAGASAITTRRRNHVKALDRLLGENTSYDRHTYLGSTQAWQRARHLFISTRGPPAIDAPRQWRKRFP